MFWGEGKINVFFGLFRLSDIYWKLLCIFCVKSVVYILCKWKKGGYEKDDKINKRFIFIFKIIIFRWKWVINILVFLNVNF